LSTRAAGIIVADAKALMMQSVLVVEDHAQLRNGMVALLRAQRHDVVAAATVAEATAHLDAATPSHLLLDLNLPDGTGSSILRRIRRQKSPIRVAIVTASANGALLNEARTLGVEEIFIKPPDWDKLLDWIAQP
jgi:two-component system OmpR family response regulator